ncbi:MAG: hypothetical protein JEZ04_20505 [Spirochaetales bacterium]|nr:hypothetical protein [Spirochaetales bacterium]
MRSKLIFFSLATLLLLIFLLTGCPASPDPPALPAEESNPSAEENNPPAGSAGTGKTVLVGETVSFTGTASDTDEDSVLTYSWSFLSVPVTSSLTNIDIAAADNLEASFTPDAGGDYVLQLTISDGTDSISPQITLQAVSFCLGINYESPTRAAYILNGVFVPLDEPEGLAAGGDFIVNRAFIYSDSEIYTGGAFVYNVSLEPLYKPVYWVNASDTVIPLNGQSFSDGVHMMEVGGDKTIHIITNEDYYWNSTEAYNGTISADPAHNAYSITGLDETSGNVYQAGIGSTPDSTTYFLAKNQVEIIHDTTFAPDPIADSEIFSCGGVTVIPGATDTETKMYLFGKYEHDKLHYAGYTVNDGTWTDVGSGKDGSTQDEQISFMLTPSDYIIRYDDIQSSTATYAVIIDGAAYIPAAPAFPAEEISTTRYLYIEKIGGCVFIGGSYRYQKNQDDYIVFTVWRDGVIVFETHDSDPQDGNDYTGGDFGWSGIDFK